jgi:hypothetical protein
MVVNHLLSM